MLTITLKNIPESLHAKLKESAERNRRSLNREIIMRLEREFVAPPVDRTALARELQTFTSRLPSVDHRRIDKLKRQGRP